MSNIKNTFVNSMSIIVLVISVPSVVLLVSLLMSLFPSLQPIVRSLASVMPDNETGIMLTIPVSIICLVYALFIRHTIVGKCLIATHALYLILVFIFFF